MTTMASTIPLVAMLRAPTNRGKSWARAKFNMGNRVSKDFQ